MTAPISTRDTTFSIEDLLAACVEPPALFVSPETSAKDTIEASCTNWIRGETLPETSMSAWEYLHRCPHQIIECGALLFNRVVYRKRSEDGRESVNTNAMLAVGNNEFALKALRQNYDISNMQHFAAQKTNCFVLFGGRLTHARINPMSENIFSLYAKGIDQRWDISNETFEKICKESWDDSFILASGSRTIRISIPDKAVTAS